MLLLVDGHDPADWADAISGLLARGPADVATAGWSAHPFGIADTHIPECFTQVTFVP